MIKVTFMFLFTSKAEKWAVSKLFSANFKQAFVKSKACVRYPMYVGETAH